MKTILSPLLGCLVTAIILCSSSLRGAVIVLDTSKDSSIFSESNNNNGLGNLYSGVAGNVVGIRRALVAFNIAGSIPAGSTINSVSLSIVQTRHGPNAISELFELRPILTSWGEGVGTTGGTGNTPTAGAVTWNYSQFNTSLWATPGGSYGPASGSTTLGLTNFVPYTFATQPGLVSDVQSWLNSPGTNNGWLLRAVNETTGFGAREIGSKDNAVPTFRPKLTIDYTAAIPEPNSLVLLGAATIFVALRSRVGSRKLNVFPA